MIFSIPPIDNVTFYFIIVLLFLLRFYLGIYKNLNYFKYGPEEDSLTYYFWAQFYDKYKLGDIDKRSLISKLPNSYTFWYLLLSLKIFGNNTLLRYSWLPNFFIHFIISLLALFFLKIENFSNISIIKFFIIYILQINSISYNNKNIHYLCFSPRFFAMAICSLYWLIIFFDRSNYIYTIFLLILSFLCINTSLFSRQTFILTNIIYFVFNQDIHLIIYLFFGLFAYFLLNKNEFKTQFINHYSHLKAYQKRNFIVNKKFKNLSIINPKKYFYLQVIFDGKNFIFLTLISFLATDSLKIELFIISLLLIFIIISLRTFSFLGESYRYSEYSMFFLFPFIMYNAQNEIYYFVIIYLLVYRFFTTSPLPKKYFKYFTELASNHVNELKEAIWYSVNFRMAQIPLCLGYGKKGFTINFSSLDVGLEKKYFSKYPYLKWNKEIIYDNNVSHILVYKPLLNEAIQISNFDPSSLKPLCENDHFIIYKVNKEIKKNFI